MMENLFKQVCQDIQKVSRQQREANNYIIATPEQVEEMIQHGIILKTENYLTICENIV